MDLSCAHSVLRHNFVTHSCSSVGDRQETRQKHTQARQIICCWLVQTHPSTPQQAGTKTNTKNTAATHLLDVVPIRQAQVFLWCHIAQQGGAQAADGGCTNGRGDVVVCGGDVSCQGAQGVEGRLTV